jgi:hypothetical protein
VGRDVVRLLADRFPECRDGLLEPSLALQNHPELVVPPGVGGGEIRRLTEGLARLGVAAALLEHGADPLVDPRIGGPETAGLAVDDDRFGQLAEALQAKAEANLQGRIPRAQEDRGPEGRHRLRVSPLLVEHTAELGLAESGIPRGLQGVAIHGLRLAAAPLPAQDGAEIAQSDGIAGPQRTASRSATSASDTSWRSGQARVR